jgi:hypothetical protein
MLGVHNDIQLPHLPKPAALVALEEEAYALFLAADKHGMFASNPSWRSTKKVAVAAFRRYERHQAKLDAAKAEWHRATDTHDARHRLAVEQALADGLTVPLKVVFEYPGLTRQLPEE